MVTVLDNALTSLNTELIKGWSSYVDYYYAWSYWISYDLKYLYRYMYFLFKFGDSDGWKWGLEGSPTKHTEG